MRSVVLGMAALLAVAGCGDESLPVGTTQYAYDPVCERVPITVDDVTYEVTSAEEVGTYTPAPEPTQGAYPREGTLERFSDGAAIWTGNGYVVTFDAKAETGTAQVC